MVETGADEVIVSDYEDFASEVPSVATSSMLYEVGGYGPRW